MNLLKTRLETKVNELAKCNETETDELIKDIEYLKNLNKERMLEKISDEHDITAERLFHRERRNSELKQFIANMQNEKDEKASID